MKRISNFQSPILNEKAFTLVEMLAVIAIFVVIGSIAMSILITSFRTSHKTDTITAVQQSGNYALTQMAKTLRNARYLIDPFPCIPSVASDTITVLTPDNQQIQYTCIAASSSPGTIASNGASLLDTNTVSLASCSFTCTQSSKSDLPIIMINFSLTQQSNSTLAEQLASKSAVPFQTTVIIRNINR